MLRKVNFLYTDFITENIEDTKENADIIDINQMYDEFKLWYQDVFNNNKIPSKIEFKKYLKKKYNSKRVLPNEIKGFKFKSKTEKMGQPISQGQHISAPEINLMSGY